MESERCKEQAPDSQPGTKETIINKELGNVNSFATPTPEKPQWSSKARAITSMARRKQLIEEFQNEGGIGEPADDITSLVAVSSEEAASSHSILPKENSVELPEKYKVLSDFFNRIQTSIRMLGLKKLLPTFGNISRQVEILTKRKLLHRHIAQMIYVYPEAFQIEKILVHDQESLLMIPEMKITLLKDIVDDLSSSRQSAFMLLCETFRVKLANFFLCHPELHTLCAGKGEHLGDKKHCEMLACLLETFEAIYCISKSTNSSVITKEELVYKILSVNLEIEERREVEEHLYLMERLFPDWICKLDAASDGQFLYSIKQTSEREAFRARLVDAV